MIVNLADLPEWVLDNIQKLLFPEEWIALDMKLSKTELVALLFVDRRGEIIMSNLAEYLNVPMSTTTGIADRLVKGGYLQRRRSESDRRIVSLALTDTGRKTIGSLRNMISGYLDVVSGILTAEEQQQLLRIATKVLTAMTPRPTAGPDTEMEHADGGRTVRKIDIQ